MPFMPLQFTPNTAFSDHIRSIQASDSEQCLDEIHRRLGEELPGADVSFADVVNELLEQSKAKQGKYAVHSHAFADQFSQVFEQRKLLDECSPLSSPRSAVGSFESEGWGDDSTIAPSESLISSTCVGEEDDPLAFAAQFAQVFEYMRLLEDGSADRFPRPELEAENWSEDDSIAPSDSISCIIVTLPEEGRTDFESSSPSDITCNPFDDPKYEIFGDQSD